MNSNKLKEIMDMDITIRRNVEQLSYALFCSASGDKDAIDMVDTMKDRGLVVVPDDIDARMSECFDRLRKLHNRIQDAGCKLHATELTDRDRLDAVGVGKADGVTDLGVFMECACTAVANVYEHIADLMETMLEYRAALDAVGLSTIISYYTPSLLIREAIGSDGSVVISGPSDGICEISRHTVTALVSALDEQEDE